MDEWTHKRLDECRLVGGVRPSPNDGECHLVNGVRPSPHDGRVDSINVVCRHVGGVRPSPHAGVLNFYVVTDVTVNSRDDSFLKRLT